MSLSRQYRNSSNHSAVRSEAFFEQEQLEGGVYGVFFNHSVTASRRDRLCPAGRTEHLSLRPPKHHASSVGTHQMLGDVWKAARETEKPQQIALTASGCYISQPRWKNKHTERRTSSSSSALAFDIVVGIRYIVIYIVTFFSICKLCQILRACSL